MFAVIAAEPSDDLAETIRAMAAKLIVGEQPAVTRIWVDAAAGLAMTGGSAGTLPEDIFDRQPYCDHQFCFVAGGRLNNRAEIAEKLGITTLELAVMADSEVLYRAFLEWGIDCNDRLSGSYSFCAIDRQSRRVVASADHGAHSSVLYAQGGKTFVVASQMGAMLAHPAIEPAPDVVALALLVAPKMLRQRTSISGVLFLEGGCFLVCAKGEVAVKRWWNPLGVQPVSYRRSDQYVEHVLHLFQAATAGCLRSTGGAAVMMSGGLDSTLVAAVAATQMRERGGYLTAYTAIPEPGIAAPPRFNWDTDEIAQSAAVAALHPNMRHVLVAPAGKTALDYLPRIYRVSQAVAGATSNIVWIESIRDRAQAAGSRVMLTGSNGNAGLSLNEHAVFGTLFADRRWGTALRLARRDSFLGGAAPWRVLAHELRFRRDQHWPTPMAPRAGLRFLQPEMVTQVREFSEQRFAPIRSRAHRAKFITNSKPFWMSDSLAQSGLDDLDPTADKRVIEAMLSFPIEASMAGGMARGMARQMGRGFVPDAVRLRRRRGEQSPEHTGLVQRHASIYGAALRSLEASPLCRSIFKLTEATAALDRICAGVLDAQAASGVEAVINVGLFLVEKGH